MAACSHTCIAQHTPLPKVLPVQNRQPASLWRQLARNLWHCSMLGRLGTWEMWGVDLESRRFVQHETAFGVREGLRGLDAEFHSWDLFGLRRLS